MSDRFEAPVTSASIEGYSVVMVRRGPVWVSVGAFYAKLALGEPLMLDNRGRKQAVPEHVQHLIENWVRAHSGRKQRMRAVR